MAKANNNTEPATMPGHLNVSEGSYLESTSRPLYALMFLLPLILVYEAGTLLVNTDQIAHTQGRVAAFTWLLAVAQWMRLPAAAAWAFPGCVVVLFLFCWHLAARHSWELRWGRLGWMALECLLLSGPLFVLGILMNMSGGAAMAGIADASNGYLANLVTSIGAGIYEELVFRLILIGLIMLLIEDVIQVKGPLAPMVAVSVSAVLFAGHHYVGIEDGAICRITDPMTGLPLPITLAGFVFRMLAGVYLAIVFRFRGYGIAAGSHAVYNMIFFAFS